MKVPLTIDVDLRRPQFLSPDWIAVLGDPKLTAELWGSVDSRAAAAEVRVQLDHDLGRAS
jgi:hypothetical protein